MPFKLFKRGKKFCVGDSSSNASKKSRCHSTKAAALKHLQAANLNMQRQKGRKV